MDSVPELTVELKRLAAGLLAVESSNERLEFARIRDVSGAGLLAGKSLPNLATIGKRIAIQMEGDRWSQVKLPAGSSETVVAAGMFMHGMNDLRLLNTERSVHMESPVRCLTVQDAADYGISFGTRQNPFLQRCGKRTVLLDLKRAKFCPDGVPSDLLLGRGGDRRASEIKGSFCGDGLAEAELPGQICVKELTVDVRWRMDKLRSFVAQAMVIHVDFSSDTLPCDDKRAENIEQHAGLFPQSSGPGPRLRSSAAQQDVLLPQMSISSKDSLGGVLRQDESSSHRDLSWTCIWNNPRQMGNPLAASVQHLYIVVLDVVTALFLAASCVRFSRKYGGVRVAHRVRQHLERLGTVLIGPNDSEVAQKLHLALCQLLVSLSKILGAVFFLRLLAIQWYQFRHEAYDLQSLDISYMIAYPVSLLCVLCQRAVRPSTLDAIYASNQLLLLLPLWLAPPADIKYVAAITLLPRFLAGLSAKRVALPLFGHCLHALLALKRLNGTEPFQAPADVLSQAAEVVGLFAGTLLVRRQLHQSVQLTSDLKSRQIELDTVSTLLLGFCDSVVELDEDLRLTEDSRQLSTTLLPEDTGTSHGLAGSDFLEFVCQEDLPAPVGFESVRGLGFKTVLVLLGFRG
ncbi:unnamed protein product [Symbiodinium sp. CCMP2592]|nr:unnamed protein product [Symbiodinium sp. CCMP2592]